jgi:hypothetical protein
MSVTIVSNISVFSDTTGHGNQGHLVYASNQGRWWLFYLASKTATTVSCSVSSSSDLDTSTWSAGTTSPAFPNSRACSTNDQRNLGVLFLNPSSSLTTDAVHLSVGIGSTGSVSAYTEHIRATFTGASSITWESWVETVSDATSSTWSLVKGNSLGIDTNGKIHEFSLPLSINMDFDLRISVNSDIDATWTNSWNAVVVSDSSMGFTCNNAAFATLASGGMLAVYDDGGLVDPNSNDLRYNKYASGTSWPTTGSASTGVTTGSRDQNDWCLCSISTTSIYVFRKSGTNSISWRFYNGTSWSTPSAAVPTQNHKAGSGYVAVGNSTSVYLFLIDSDAANTIRYNIYDIASGTWGTWVALETSTAVRNYISGYPVISNNKIGVIWSETNGSNFNIVVGTVNITPSTTIQDSFRWRNDDGSESAATWLATQNTAVTQPMTSNIRLRVLVDNTANPPVKKYRLEYRKGSGNWRKVQ